MTDAKSNLQLSPVQPKSRSSFSSVLPLALKSEKSELGNNPDSSANNKASMNLQILFLLLFILQTHLAICSGASDLGLNRLPIDEIDSMLKRACAGKMGACEMESAEEYEMDSEVSRRVLVMQKRYISYETLKRDTVPCATPGASYYDCGSAEANRYGRGCDVITRCARNIRD